MFFDTFWMHHLCKGLASKLISDLVHSLITKKQKVSELLKDYILDQKNTKKKKLIKALCA